MRTRREAKGASRAFLQLSEGNELAAEHPSLARRAVAVLLAGLFLFSVSLFWAGGADLGKILRPSVAAAHDDSDGEDNSGPGGGDDEDDSVTSGLAATTASATSAVRDTAGTTQDSVSTFDTTTSLRRADTRGTTGPGNDSTRATTTGTSRAEDSSNRTTRGGTTA